MWRTGQHVQRLSASESNVVALFCQVIFFVAGPGEASLGTLVRYKLILKFFGSVSIEVFKVGGWRGAFGLFPLSTGTHLAHQFSLT